MINHLSCKFFVFLLRICSIQKCVICFLYSNATKTVMARKSEKIVIHMLTILPTHTVKRAITYITTRCKAVIYKAGFISKYHMILAVLCIKMIKTMFTVLCIVAHKTVGHVFGLTEIISGASFIVDSVITLEWMLQ